MGLEKTSYNLIYNTDGSLCVTIREDDVPFEGVKSFAVEEGTTNVLLGINNYVTQIVSGTLTVTPTTYKGKPALKCEVGGTDPFVKIGFSSNATINPLEEWYASIYIESPDATITNLKPSNAYLYMTTSGFSGFGATWHTERKYENNRATCKLVVPEGYGPYTNPKMCVFFEGTGTYYIYYPQLEKKPFATSFMDGTRQDGFLYFENLAPSVIAYWVKHLYLIETHYHLTLTNPNDEANNSLGIRTSDSVYKVRRQVDGVKYDNQIISTTTNVWNFHVLIFTGSTYELYINGEHQLSISEIPNGLNRVIIGNFTKTNPIFPADSLFANIYFGEYDPNIWTDEYIQELYNARKPFKVPEGAKFI